MSEAAVKLLSEDSPETRLRALKAQRTVLSQRIADLAEARQRLGETADAERAATAALANLDAIEIAATSAWASRGASGAPPAADLTLRTKLAANLSAAQAATAAARGAAANVEGIQAGLRAELAELAADIENAALDCLELERVAAMKELAAVAGQAARLTARVRSHAICLGERGRHLRDSGDPGRAQQYFILAEALAGKPLPDPAPSAGDVDMARREWLARWAGLIE